MAWFLLVDVDDVLREVVNTHTPSNLLIEMLKHDELSGTICISVPHPLQILGTNPPSPVIYAHDAGPMI